MSKERFEWLYNETMLKHYMVDNQNNIQLGYEAIVNLLNQQNKQISDLEAKLAEKERDFDLLMLSKNEEINEWIAVRDDKNKVIDRQTDKIQELKKRLAEKDKEKDYYQDLYFNAVKKQERTNKVVEQFQQRVKYFSEKDQDKIEFAIEQLEQLRHDIWTNQADDGYTDMQVDLYDLNDVIDVRIMQIKEQKDV